MILVGNNKSDFLVKILYYFAISGILFSIASVIIQNFEIGQFFNIWQQKSLRQPIIYSLKISLITAIIVNICGSIISIIWLYFSRYIQKILLILFAVASTLPSIFVVIGWRTIIGNNGIVDNLLGWDIKFFYSFGGMLLIYVYFNLPLAGIVYSLRVSKIPLNHLRLSAQLGLSSFEHWRRIIMPAWWSVFPGTFLIVFYFCFQDFNIPFLLGTRPQHSTLSLLIFQSIIYEGNIALSAALSIIHLLPTFLLLAGFLVAKKQSLAVEYSTLTNFLPHHSMVKKISAAIFISLLVLFLSSPILLAQFYLENSDLSLAKIFDWSGGIIWQGLKNSLIISVCVGTISGFLGYIYLVLTLKNKHMLGIPWIILLLPQLTIGLGLFLWLHSWQLSSLLEKLWFYILINSIIYFPIVSYIWREQFIQARKNNQHLISSLGLSNWQVFWYLDRLTLGRSLLLGWAIVACLSLSDLTIISVFNPPFQTLAMVQKNLSQSYNFNAAFSVQSIFLLLIICFYLPVLVSKLKSS